MCGFNLNQLQQSCSPSLGGATAGAELGRMLGTLGIDDGITAGLMLGVGAALSTLAGTTCLHFFRPREAFVLVVWIAFCGRRAPRRPGRGSLARTGRRR